MLAIADLELERENLLLTIRTLRNELACKDGEKTQGLYDKLVCKIEQFNAVTRGILDKDITGDGQEMRYIRHMSVVQLCILVQNINDMLKDFVAQNNTNEQVLPQNQVSDPSLGLHNVNFQNLQ